MLRFLFLFMMPLCALAQELTSEISPQSGTTSDEYTFTVTINGSADTSKPVLSTGSDFDASYLGPQSSVTIVNGKMSSYIQHVYRLYPKRKGNLLTPSVEARVGGKKLTAPPIAVTVAKSTPPSAQAGSEYFLEQHIDKKKAYAGEQIVNTLRLYARVRVLEANFSDLSFDRVWVEEMGKQESYRKSIGGNTYTVHELKRALYPLVQSDLTLPEREILIKIVDRNKKQGGPLSRFGFFSDNMFGFAQTAIKRLRSKPLDISVLPLPVVPSELRDSEASSIPVGETRISTGLNTDTVAVGASKTISIVVQSTGNLHPLEDIALPSIEGVKVYPEPPETSYTVQQGKLLTKKTFKYSFVPLRGGIIKIPPLKLLFFDPNKEKYELTQTRETQFFVKGEPPSALTTTTSGPETIQSPPEESISDGEDKTPKRTPYLQKTHFIENFHLVTLLIILSSFIAFLLLALLLIRFLRSKSKRNELLAKIQSGSDPVDLRENMCIFLNNTYRPEPLIHTGNIKERLSDLLNDEGLTFKILSLADELELHSYSNKNDMRPITVIAQDLAQTLSSAIPKNDLPLCPL